MVVVKLAAGRSAVGWCVVQLLMLLVLVRAGSAAADRSTEELLQREFTRLTAPADYHQHVRPFPQSGQPVHVHARVYVYFLGDIDAQASDFFVQLLVRQRWNDPRLKYNVSELCIQGEEWHVNRLWIPTIYLVNQKEAKIIDVSHTNVFVSLCPDGSVYYSFRLKTTLFCSMDLRKFPFDEPTCPVLLESWLHSTEDMVMTWERESPYSTNVITLSEYGLNDITVSNNTFHFPEQGAVQAAYRRVDKTVAYYSRLILEFHMSREPGYYLLDYYIPSGFLVIVSWVSFWLSPEAAPARVTLGTSTMLTFITLSNTIKNSLPKVSYTKRVDIWLFICTTFIFLSLVEFAFVNTIFRRRKNVELKKVTAKHVLKSTLKPSASSSRMDKSASCSTLDGLSPRSPTSLMVPQSPPPEMRHRPSVFFVGDETAGTMQGLNGRSEVGSSPRSPPVGQSLDSGLNSSTSVTSMLVANLAAGAHAMVQDPPQPAAPEPVRRPSMFQRPFVEMTPQQIAKWIDIRSRWLFPICFIATNIGYWVSTAI